MRGDGWRTEGCNGALAHHLVPRRQRVLTQGLRTVLRAMRGVRVLAYIGVQATEGIGAALRARAVRGVRVDVPWSEAEGERRGRRATRCTLKWLRPAMLVWPNQPSIRCGEVGPRRAKHVSRWLRECRCWSPAWLVRHERFSHLRRRRCEACRGNSR